MKTFLILSLALLPLVTLAQTSSSPLVFLTWHADTYIPADYAGKALITPGSHLSLTVEVVNKNQLVSLKNQMIRWYEQGHLSKAGIGLQSFETNANVLSGNDYKIRVEVPDFPEKAISKTISLRVVSPKVVIDTPFPNLERSIQDFSIRAIPYFFSVLTENSLTYQWFANNTALSGSGDPQTVSVLAKDLRTSGVRSLIFRATAQNNNQYLDKGEGAKTISVTNDSQ